MEVCQGSKVGEFTSMGPIRLWGAAGHSNPDDKIRAQFPKVYLAGKTHLGDIRRRSHRGLTRSTRGLSEVRVDTYGHHPAGCGEVGERWERLRKGRGLGLQ